MFGGHFEKKFLPNQFLVFQGQDYNCVKFNSTIQKCKVFLLSKLATKRYAGMQQVEDDGGAHEVVAKIRKRIAGRFKITPRTQSSS